MHKVILLFLLMTISLLPQDKEKIEKIQTKIRTEIKNNVFPIALPRNTRLDTIIVNNNQKTLDVKFTRDFAGLAFREDNVNRFYEDFNKYFSSEFPGYALTLYSMNIPIQELIPNLYRGTRDKYDISRMPKPGSPKGNVVNNISRAFYIDKGLNDRNIVLWQSHGWYYSNNVKRWEWQRPRLFEAVEDKIPLSFVIPYLAPMLENAGANVYIPRERDFNENEVIVDNDDRKSKSYSEKGHWDNGSEPGFKDNKVYNDGKIEKEIIYDNRNLFLEGTYRKIKADIKGSAEIKWVPNIPEDGKYAVYISYKGDSNNVTDADYTVVHKGIKTKFKINQSIGGSTWFYLGTFEFKKGLDAEENAVILTNKSNDANKFVTADGVRFGGGMGFIARDSIVSNRPKYVEAARYWLQSAGMPDTLVYSLNKGINDYNDDYQSRNEYANYLKGAPYGPNKMRDARGLQIPIDLSMAFHTDAGVTRNDTVIGTLAIYSLNDMEGKTVFPDSVSRLACRDLADIVQTEICNDIKARWDTTWTRRDVRNAVYGETARPNVPSLILELLSHQNFLDMKFVHDPKFRFDVSRSIYKGMLKFLSAQHGYSYVVQPLPVTHFATSITSSGIELTWRPQADSLEPSAMPLNYVVYIKEGDKDFDNGTLVKDTFYVFNKYKKDVVYSFKITAVNDGGESFPSEILAACITKSKEKPVLIVNGFDRTGAAFNTSQTGFEGFVNYLDNGVQDRWNTLYTGEQYDFDSTHVWLTNDAPGHGASAGSYETKLFAANTFDYSTIHGNAIKEAGYSFASISDEAFEDKITFPTEYLFIDMLMGEEKETFGPTEESYQLQGISYKIFNDRIKNNLQSYLKAGGKLFISGAYIASDLKDSLDIKFASEVLRYKIATKFGATQGSFFPSGKFAKKEKAIEYYSFNNTTMYAVEAPDAIDPVNGSEAIFRFNENSFGAGTAYNKDYKVITLSIPFETIKKKEQREYLMKEIISFMK